MARTNKRAAIIAEIKERAEKLFNAKEGRLFDVGADVYTNFEVNPKVWLNVDGERISPTMTVNELLAYVKGMEYAKLNNL